MSATSPDAKRRVKLYALNASRQWDDKGTGHVTSCYHEPLDGMSLLVRNESDGSLLLESKIQLDTQYQKQQGTLIVWTESDNYDLALSFQERDGCNEIWEKICQIQGRDPSYEQDNDEDQEEVRINLIECDQDKLQLILEQITAFSQTTRRKDVLATEYIENDYIQKLLNLFRQAEERQDLPTLHRLYEIFKQLFLYDRPTLTEAMLSEPLLMDIIGVFEYEPQQDDKTIDNNNSDTVNDTTTTTTSTTTTTITTNNNNNNNNKAENEVEIDSDQPPSEDTTLLEQEQEQEQEQQRLQKQQIQHQQIMSRKRHREFLQNGTTFKEVIPFSDQKIIDKIHQTYRVQYLQTSVLPTPSIIEENAYGSLTNILFFNKVEIVSMIQENGQFLKNLFKQIISNETGIDRKRELVLFLKEYCMFSQTIQPKQRENLFKTLASIKILSAVEVALSSDDQVIKSAAIDIFTYLVEYSPHMTRQHAVQQREGITEPPNRNAQTANILKLVIEHITTDQDPELGTAVQLSCIIKLLLDPENMPGDIIGKLSFLEFFYFTCMQSLVEPIKNSTTPNGDIEPSANDRKTAQLLSIVLELLTFFAEHHFGQLRNYIESSDLLTRITSLIKSKHKFLVLSVIRFFRRLVATKDGVYWQLIINEDSFNPIIEVLKNNNGRYNLLDSAILEMFEYICTENLIPLIIHIVNQFGSDLESIDYVNTFKNMKQKKADALNVASPLLPLDNALKGRSSPDTDRLSRSPPDEPYETSSWGNPSGPDDDEDTENISLSELELITMNCTKNAHEMADDDEEEEEDVDDEEDIQMDEEDRDDELEPQFKKKKTK